MPINNYSNLYLSPTDSDVTLIIEEAEIPAHRSILSKRSKYFKTLFSSSFNDAKSDKIVIKETSLKTFKTVLKYVYTGTADHFYDGSLPLDELFAIFACTRFYMVEDVTSKIYNYINNSKESFDPRWLLTNALSHSVHELISSSTDFILANANCIYDKIFDQMSPLAVEYFLKLRLNTYESTIFKAFVSWMHDNPGYSASFPDLLKHIELHLIEEGDLNTLFTPIPFIDRNFYKNLLNQQQEQANMVQKVVNYNILTETNVFRIIDGEIKTGNVQPVYPKNYFIIDLRNKFLLNCLKLQAVIAQSYTVNVSTDLRSWKCVVDHSKYTCIGLQVLYFRECPVRFIRIQCEYGILSINDNIQALYSTDPFEIDPNTTLIIPNQNVVPTEMSLKWNPNAGGGYTHGEIIDGHIRHKINNHSRITFQFSQPYVIGNMKLRLNEESSYYVDVATMRNGECTRVFAEENVSGWRTATFEKQAVSYIIIVGTKSSSGYFHLYKLECPPIRKFVESYV